MNRYPQRAARHLRLCFTLAGKKLAGSTERNHRANIYHGLGTVSRLHLQLPMLIKKKTASKTSCQHSLRKYINLQVNVHFVSFESFCEV
jgi:hypothetical protein